MCISTKNVVVHGHESNVAVTDTDRTVFRNRCENYVFVMDRGEIGSGGVHRLKNVVAGGQGGTNGLTTLFFLPENNFCFWLLSLRGASKNGRNIF